MNGVDEVHVQLVCLICGRHYILSGIAPMMQGMYFQARRADDRGIVIIDCNTLAAESGLRVLQCPPMTMRLCEAM